MRQALIIGLVFAAVAMGSTASAQLAHEDPTFNNSGPPQNQRSNGGSSNSRNSRGHRGEDDHSAPPPLMRCADLALASYTFVTAIPGQPALGADEIALQWDIHNAGSAPYQAATSNDTSLVLVFASPSGEHQVAALAVPVAQGGAVSDHGVMLGQNQSWRGYMRATLTPEARRRTLRLRINYGPPDALHPYAVNDCDTGNNEVDLARPPAAAPPPPPAG